MSLFLNNVNLVKSHFALELGGMEDNLYVYRKVTKRSKEKVKSYNFQVVFLKWWISIFLFCYLMDICDSEGCGA